jgi:hypothetical protein
MRAASSPSFTNVLKKFFTGAAKHENKSATRCRPEVPPMFEDLQSAIARAGASLPADMAGAAAIVVLFLAALHLPGLV